MIGYNLVKKRTVMTEDPTPQAMDAPMLMLIYATQPNMIPPVKTLKTIQRINSFSFMKIVKAVVVTTFALKEKKLLMKASIQT